MKEELKSILSKEKAMLKNLLEALDKQYAMIVKNDVFGLEAIVEDIQLSNKAVAEQEVKRRALTQGNSMNEIINSYKDEELEELYKDIRVLLNELQLQKDSNELLLKQNISYTNQILNLINPNRGSKTYNSTGKIR